MRVFKNTVTRNFTFWHLQLNHGFDELQYCESLNDMIAAHTADHRDREHDHYHTDDKVF